MIAEDYVSFEIAKILKDKEFNEKVISYYDTEGQGYFISSRECNIGTGSVYAAPTLQMVMKWLREVHNLSVRPRYEEVEDEKELLHYLWFFDILSMNPYKMLIEPKQGYDTYEEAAEDAIRYCLENLI